MSDPGYTPRTARKRGRQPDPDLRLRILEVARDIITESGLDGLKARIVAKAAGTSVGTLYNTTGPIEDLVRLINAETYDDLYAVQTRALAAAREVGASPTMQLHALADSYLDWVGTHQRQWLATLSYNRARREAPPDWYQSKERALLGIVEDALQGFADLDTDQCRIMAQALWASVHGIVTMAVGDGFWMVPVEQTRRQMALIIDAVADQL